MALVAILSVPSALLRTSTNKTVLTGTSVLTTNPNVVRNHVFYLDTGYTQQVRSYVTGDHYRPTNHYNLKFGLKPAVEYNEHAVVQSYRFSSYPHVNTFQPSHTSSGLPYSWSGDLRVFVDDDKRKELHNKVRLNFLREDFNLGTALGESRETVGYIADKTKEALIMALAIKSGKLRAMKKAFQKFVGFKIQRKHISADIAGRWLEWQFAVLPLISDIDAGTKAFREHIDHGRLFDRPMYVSSRSTVKYSFTMKPVNNHARSTTKVISKCKCYAFISNVDAYNAAQNGLLPVNVAWELTPFSFLVDYFIGVGKFLEATNATQGLKFIMGWESYRLSTSGYMQQPKSIYGTKYPMQKMFGDGYVRNLMTDFPPVSLLYAKPLSSTKTANVLALITSVASGLFNKRS